MGQHATVPRPRGIRRFLRFSLRSLMLVILAVAAWLGYEVHQARTVQRQAEAIRALGGDVEFEASPWSLLRFIEPQTYGRRIAAAELPAENTDLALPQLASMASLREVRPVVEGTSDQHLSWVRLRASLRNIKNVPTTRRRGWLDDDVIRRERCRRFREKIKPLKKTDDRDDPVIESVELWSQDSPPAFCEHRYHPVQLCDGSLAEVLVLDNVHFGQFIVGRAVILVVDDQCVDARYFDSGAVSVSIEHANGGNRTEVGVRLPNDWKDSRIQTLRGDPRGWLALYTIERSGLRSLLPEDHFKRALLERKTEH